MKKSSGVHVIGPLKPYAAGFERKLKRQGYSSCTAQAHVQLLGHLSCWLVAHEVDPGELTAERVEAFLADRRAGGRRRWASPRGVTPLLGYLREHGVVPEPPQAAAQGPVKELLEEFADYLVGERGLAEFTTRAYCYFAELLLSTRSWRTAERRWKASRPARSARSCSPSARCAAPVHSTTWRPACGR
jgi:site-specific recombinase XerD